MARERLQIGQRNSMEMKNWLRLNSKVYVSSIGSGSIKLMSRPMSGSSLAVLSALYWNLIIKLIK